MKRLLTAVIFASMFGSIASAATIDAAPKDLRKNFVRGVYFGLDPNGLRPNAEKVGKDIPGFLDQLFHDLHDTYHCNLFWSNTGGLAEYVQAMDVAAKHDIKIIGRYCPYEFSPMDTEAKMEAWAKETTDAYKSKKACGGYVVCEEIQQATVAQMDYYRRLVEQFDPSPARPPLLVTCGPLSSYAYRTGFPIMCPDVYLFGGPNAICNANTPESSRDYYTQLLTGLGDTTRRSGKVAWVMPQAFACVDGKYWTDNDGNLVIEPGSNWSLRMPTPAEMRFQIWEAVRVGCRGVVFFLALPYWPDWRPDKANLSEAEKKWGAAMDKSLASLKGHIKQRTNTGAPGTLLRLGGGPTPHSRTMGEAFAAIEKLEPLLVSWKRAEFPAVFADRMVGVETFQSPEKPRRRFAVVLNRNTVAKQDMHLLFAPNVTGVTDLRSDKPLSLKPAVNDFCPANTPPLFLL